MAFLQYADDAVASEAVALDDDGVGRVGVEHERDLGVDDRLLLILLVLVQLGEGQAGMGRAS